MLNYGLVFFEICFFFSNISGLMTFNDGSHGFPRCEGFFQDCKLVKKQSCGDVIQKAQKIAFMARNQQNM